MKKIVSNILVLSLILFIPLVVACSSNNESKHDEVENDGYGDNRETTASIDTLPTFLNEASDDMRMLYTAVAQSQSLLENIPCYCGCGEVSFEHQNNYDCFVHQNNQDGSLIWDDHATKCQSCLDIAAQSIIEHNDGKSVKEIRNMIDTKYKENSPDPTPTPEV